MQFSARKRLHIVCCVLLGIMGSLAADEAKVYERNLTRDILQPLGMPIVTGFHKMRESVFFNTQDKDAIPLESIGNFFFIPSRYLFGGKTIELKNKETLEYAQTSSFSYRKLHFLKTTLAITVLPVTEILGSFFKGLAFLSPSVKKRHDQYVKSRFVVPKSSKEAFIRQTGITTLYSTEEIPCLHYARPSQLTTRQKIEIEALKEITALFDARGIPYWLDCGSALGAYRYGGFIPWDWDIDIAILLSDHQTVKALLKGLNPDLYEIQDWSSYSKPNSFLKLYVKKTQNFIDIYHYQVDPDKQEMFFYYTYLDSPFPQKWKQAEIKCIKPVSYETIFPLKKATFDGVSVFAPNHIVAFLQSKYGENLAPSNIWNEEKKIYEKVLDHPYWKQ